MVNTDPNDKNDFNSRLLRARSLFEKGDFEAASFIYHQLIDEANDKTIGIVELWVELAWAYYRLNRFESTIICLKQVIEKPRNYNKIFDVYRLKGLCHLHLGRLKIAADDFEKALELIEFSDPDRRFLLYDLGQVYFQRGEYPLAKEIFAEAKTLFEYENNNEELAKIHYSLGFCHYYLDDYRSALTEFEDMFAIADEKPTRALALYGQSFIMLNFSSFEKLIQLVNEIPALDPEFQDKETLAYFLCRSYKALQDRVKFDLFYRELKKNYPEGKYASYYADLENW